MKWRMPRDPSSPQADQAGEESRSRAARTRFQTRSMVIASALPKPIPALAALVAAGVDVLTPPPEVLCGTRFCHNAADEAETGHGSTVSRQRAGSMP